MNAKLSYNRAIIELCFAGGIWGFGFVATVYALEGMGPLTMTAARFILSFVLVFPFLFFVKGFHSHKHKELFQLAVVPGLLLGGLLVLQTWGLKYTTATKSGFITTLYIVFVPFIENRFLGAKVGLRHALYVILGLFGTALICNFQGGEWNIGDLMTLGCSAFATIQIVCLGRMSHKIDSSVAFNTYQSFWAAILPLVMLIFYKEDIQWPMPGHATFGFIWLLVGSTIIAFLIQIRAQKVISASVASLLFLLESPFAALFAFFLLGEVLSLSQWLGACLILISACGVVMLSRKQTLNTDLKDSSQLLSK